MTTGKTRILKVQDPQANKKLNQTIYSLKNKGKEIQRVKHMKRCPTSLINKEKHIKLHQDAIFHLLHWQKSKSLTAPYQEGCVEGSRSNIADEGITPKEGNLAILIKITNAYIAFDTPTHIVLGNFSYTYKHTGTK